MFGPDEKVYGEDASIAAEFQAVWYATHVLSVADFEQTAKPEQMRIMRAAARRATSRSARCECSVANSSIRQTSQVKREAPVDER